MAEKREDRTGPGPWKSAAVAALCALVPCVFVPFQTWLGNSTALGFGAGPLLRELSILWLLAAAALWLFVWLGGRLLGRLPLALVLAGAFYAYLETGILTIGSPPLDGGLAFWSRTDRIVLDTAVLLAVFAGAIAARKFLAQWALPVAGAVALLSAASLADVKPENVKTVDNLAGDDNPFSAGIIPRNELAGRAFFSSNRNVVVFILDSTTSEVFCDVLDKEPDIAAAFQGFRVYRDVVGRYATTPFGVASLFSGRPYDGTESVGQYVASPFSCESPLFGYLEADVPTFVQLGSFKRFAFANRGGEAPHTPAPASPTPPDGPLISRRIDGEQKWSLSELVRFRLAPFARKAATMESFMLGWEKPDRSGDHISERETWLYPKLAAIPVSGAEELTLHVYHTRGTHEPFTRDRNGRNIHPVRGYRGAYEYTCFVLRQLGALLGAMDKRGVYDNSTVIVTADHGMSYSATKTKHGVNVVEKPIFNRAFPCFAVKAPGMRGPPQYAAVPVLHANFHDLLADVRLAELGTNRIDEILSADGERVFTNMTATDASGAWEEFVVLGNGSVTNRFAKPKRDPSRLPPIQTGKNYSFKFLENTLSDSYPPVAGDGLSDARVWGAGFVSGKVGMTMRVPDPSARYDVTLGMEILQPKLRTETILFMGNQSFHLWNVRKGTAKLIGKTGDSASVTLPGLVPGEDGFLTVTAEKEGTKARVFFVSIRVDKR